jgi:hypothetical protein
MSNGSLLSSCCFNIIHYLDGQKYRFIVNYFNVDYIIVDYLAISHLAVNYLAFDDLLVIVENLSRSSPAHHFARLRQFCPSRPFVV